MTTMRITPAAPAPSGRRRAAVVRQWRIMRRSLIVLGLLLAAAPARAQRPAEPPSTPSTFTYGFHGFLLGAGVGVGVGYLAGRSDGWQNDDWRSLAYGAGVGA